MQAGAHTQCCERNPIMDSIRQFGLHPLQKETPQGEQGVVDMASFKNTLVASSGNQAAEAQLYRTDNTWTHPVSLDDGASISGGRLSPDLGDMWRYGCLRSPDWDSECGR